MLNTTTFLTRNIVLDANTGDPVSFDKLRAKDEAAWRAAHGSIESHSFAELSTMKSTAKVTAYAWVKVPPLPDFSSSRHLGASLGPAKMIGLAGDELLDAAADGPDPAVLICRDDGLVLLHGDASESLPGACLAASLVRADGRLFVLHEGAKLNAVNPHSAWWYLDSTATPGKIASCSPDTPAAKMTVADTPDGPAFLWAEENGGVLSLMQMPAGI